MNRAIIHTNKKNTMFEMKHYFLSGFT